MRNQIEYVVHGKYALFTDPITKIGGEKFTYQVPTYEALKGITESIYWKPSITWIVDEVRVMHPIQTEVKGMRPIRYHDNENDLAYYTYLRNPCYQVRAHFEFNQLRPDLKADWVEEKHHNIAKRAVLKGGRRDIFLGTRECQGYVEYAAFGSGTSCYDDYGEIAFGPMFHGFNYPDETGGAKLETRLWAAEMVNGVIAFPPPEQCEWVRPVKEMDTKSFVLGQNMQLVTKE
ncbi:type I-C CRISPR-associated protein Cas5c [Robertmurraya sp. DFI.2.37]|uniref:type I-C CRISPR-associated protein Cas5c n=1 Tax=Robertmurraya sp. DFI.2.37 TaxID=3031819 RepID=UPI0012455C75|nr:type I-C CRISPR-associated protein Cas5c [Robertmurraya sp. DFI.2.37]MDF1508804.1 type I-C CRISPR-associated protein Cas5c [Robertmurraya sp. DFI.2.37]